jgi:hypothetical protein
MKDFLGRAQVEAWVRCRTVHVGLVDKVALRQVYLRVLLFPSVIQPMLLSHLTPPLFLGAFLWPQFQLTQSQFRPQNLKKTLFIRIGVNCNSYKTGAM